MAQTTVQHKFTVSVPEYFAGFKLIRTLGKGNFSLVLLAQKCADEQFYAVKVFSKQALIESKGVDQFQREITVFASLDHPNILKLGELVDDETQIYVSMEYCSKGDLAHFLGSHAVLAESVAKRLFTQIVEALSYLHNKNIAHRDLKPENILLDHNLNIKLGDFGFAHESTSDNLLKTQCGSPAYVAPEIISSVPYDGLKADIWSLGVILYVLLCGKIPWNTTNQAQLFYQIQTAQFHVPEHVSIPAKNLINTLMNPIPQRRPNILEIFRFPWLLDGASVLSMDSIRTQSSDVGNVIQNSNKINKYEGNSVRVITRNSMARRIVPHVVIPKSDRHSLPIEAIIHTFQENL